MRIGALTLPLAAHTALRARIDGEPFVDNLLAAVDTNAVGRLLHALVCRLDVAQFDDVAVDDCRIEIDQRTGECFIGGVGHQNQESKESKGSGSN